ncbi:uncharacterized protein M421DRAFT_419738 [Didymella exigua CBS 183.55]|uniref:Uncharacterized protein n=1 Tax=Didymella exigua CBS 183.55 TaxID=1150837 RepID=A0A6A5RSB6_9PLEO|nr:uncharacterized protein M421DRAFT_419738 [Didymella exigua CBS 183.55]KAF1929216.1 hypothetical protein M421DRAFT_419738 [Didymella exigua CBS 183.55]
MDKIKEKLHIGSSRRKSQPENDISATSGTSNTVHSTTFNSGPGHAAPAGAAGTHGGNTIEDTYEDRGSFDEELATMSPDERVAYLREYDDSDKHDEPKKGGLIEKLIARGNKRTEEQLEREHAERTAGQTNLSGAAATAGQNPVIR